MFCVYAVDVVPVGDASQWDTDPFAVQEKDDKVRISYI